METQRKADNHTEGSAAHRDLESAYAFLRSGRESLEQYKKRSGARMINEEES